jgi:peptidyl-prolyl cis-trans isomerase SurA
MMTLLRNLRLPALGLSALALLAMSAMLPLNAGAQQLVGRIVASVNDDAITDYDVDGRIRLIAASANAPVNAETQQRYARIALRELIDDRLKAQEAKRLGISANDKETGAAIQTIERNNKMAPGGLMKELTQKRVPVGALIDQVKASILWRKVLRRRVLPQVRVATNEVDDALNRIREAGGRFVARAAEIVLPAGTPEDRREANARAEEIRSQLAAGAKFPELARRYSRSTTAAVGGDMGEVQSGQLPQALDEALAALQPGQVSEPIYADGAIHILLLVGRQGVEAGDSREAVITLARLFLPITEASNADARGDEARAAVAGLDSCDAFEAAAKRIDPRQPPRIVDARIGDMPEEIRDTIDALKPGEQSPIVEISNGVAIFMLCRRAESGDTLPTASRIADALQRQRAERRADRYLRDLRRLAFIDIRG